MLSKWLGYLSEGANAAGASLVGFVPHREPGGKTAESVGLHVESMLSAPRHAYILHGVEPDHDFADSELAVAALKSADVVVALTAFADDDLLDCCNIVLPIGTFAETDGTFVNGEGRWQSFSAAATPYGDSRPAWRVLRVLANELGVDGCDYQEIGQIQDEIACAVGQPAGDSAYTGSPSLDFSMVEVEIDQLDVPVYSIDPLVRRSQPLQETKAARDRQDAESPERRAV